MKRGISDVEVFGASSSSSSSKVDVALTGCVSKGSSVGFPKMPWELTPHLESMFNSGPLPWLANPKIPMNLPSLPVSSMPPLSDRNILERKRLAQTLCYKASDRHHDEQRAQVLLQWSDLVLRFPTASVLGQQLLKSTEDVDGNASFQIISDTLQSRATSTLKLRASSLALFFRWHENAYSGSDAIPFEEEKVYEYLCHLRTTGSSATRGSTFVGTMNSVGDLLGVLGAKDCALSARIKGASLSMFLEKRPLKQAPALHPVIIAILEIACFAEADTFLRAVAGFCLCCLYGRLRISDLNRLTNLSVRGRYVEGSLMRTKTARNKEKQCTFLPVVFPCIGFLDANWYRAFEETRDCLQLSAVPTLESRSHDRNFVMLPSYATVSSDLPVSISTTEVTDSLQVILGKVLDEDTVRDITSHSLKTSILTFLGEAGCDYTHSELLGYHLTSHKSSLNYQRQALAAPLRFMMRMLELIRDGALLPLGNRDEYHVPEHKRRTVAEQLTMWTGLSIGGVAELMWGQTEEDMLHSTNTELSGMWQMFCTETVSLEIDDTEEHVRDELPEEVSSLRTVLRSDESMEIEDEVLTPQAEGANESDSDTSVSSTYSSSGSDSAECAMAVVAHEVGQLGRVRNVSRNALADLMYRHRRTKVLHLEHKDDGAKTACGRSLGETYARYYGGPDKAWPHCTHCWGDNNP